MRRDVVLTAGITLLLTACRPKENAVLTNPLEDVFHQQAQEEGLSRTQTEGRRLFLHYCATCHGETGRGDGQNAYSLDPAPPDFQESLSQHPPSYWRDIIVGGTAALGRSPLCPPRGRSLATADVDALVSYLEVAARSERHESSSEEESRVN